MVVNPVQFKYKTENYFLRPPLPVSEPFPDLEPWSGFEAAIPTDAISVSDKKRRGFRATC